nr:ABC transporter permease subunit [Pseudomonas sp. BAY1663]
MLFLTVLLSAQFSGRQPATVALDIGLSVIRLLLPLVLILMVQELVSREFDRRYFLNTLTYPCPRHSLLLGRFIAIATLILGLLLLLAGALAVLVWLIDQATHKAHRSHWIITTS